MYPFVYLLSVMERPYLHVLHADIVERVRCISGLLFGCLYMVPKWWEIEGRGNMRKAHEGGDIILGECTFAAFVVVCCPCCRGSCCCRGKGCTAAKMLRLMIAPMSSAVGCCTCAGRYAGPGSSPAITTLVEDGPMVVSRRCTI